MGRGDTTRSGSKTENLRGVTYEIPETWSKKVSEDGNSAYYYPINSDDLISIVVMFQYTPMDHSDYWSSGELYLLNSVADSLNRAKDIRNFSKNSSSFGNIPIVEVDCNKLVDSISYSTHFVLMPVFQKGLFVYGCSIAPDLKDFNYSELNNVFSSIKIPESPSRPADSPEPLTSPALPSYGPGTLRAGVDIPAGEYLVMINSGSRSGYFSVNSDPNGKNIIFNGNFEYNSIVTVNDGEFIVLKRSNAFAFDKWCSQNILDTGKTGSMMKIGVNLPKGQYKLRAISELGGYYCIYPDSRQKKIISNENFEGQTYVEVLNGQYLFLSRCIIDNPVESDLAGTS